MVKFIESELVLLKKEIDTTNWIVPANRYLRWTRSWLSRCLCMNVGSMPLR